MSKAQTITAGELKRRLDEGSDLMLIDTSLQEDYEEAHLPHARNACVYEVTFLDQVRQITGDPEKTIVVYGSSLRSLASSVAAAKLAEAGYKNLVDFRGGIEAWRDAGHPLEGTRQVKRQSAVLQDKIYQIDTTNSIIEWVGRNLANKHAGTIRISEGEVSVEQGHVVRGHFVIDLNSILNTDIADKDYAQILVNHLKSDDFFDTSRHPTARFVIDRADPIQGATPGSPNHTIQGKLTVKGVAHEIDFAALIGATEEGQLAAQAHFDLDRTEWGVLYGSGKFFENLGKHLVNDLISVQFKIIAR